MNTPLAALIAQFDWIVWGAILMIGLPLLVVLLGELAQDLRRWKLERWRKALDLVRNSCLFLLFGMILLREVVGLAPDHLAVKLVDTLFWVTVLNVGLVVFNVVVFESGTEAWHAKAPKLLLDLGRALVVAVGASLIISHVWQVDLTGLLAALGVGSIVIGLALQDTLSNLFAGVMMVTVRQLDVGDWIRVGDTDGQVRSISWRAVTVATLAGDIVDIPNSQIYRERLRIYGADQSRVAVSTELKFSNEYPPEQIKNLVAEAATITAGVLAAPAPSAGVKCYEDGVVVYAAGFWVADFRKIGGARSEFLTNLWYVAGRSGVRLQGHVVTDGVWVNRQNGEPSVGAVPATTRPAAAEIPALLAALGTFQLPASALGALSDGARLERYRVGEVLIRPGRLVEAAFVVVEGTAQATRPGESGNAPVATYTKGDLILFKSFFRGGDAPVVVSGLSDLELVRIPIETLEAALDSDAKLSTQIEQLLTTRERADRADPARTPNASDVDAEGSQEERSQLLRALFR